MLEWLREFLPDDPRGLTWLAIGVFGQVLFFSRWIVQWLASEKAKESTMPVLFWYFSLCGSLLVLSYGIREREPILVLGQGTGTAIYLRNLVLLSRMKRLQQALSGGARPPEADPAQASAEAEEGA